MLRRGPEAKLSVAARHSFQAVFQPAGPARGKPHIFFIHPVCAKVSGRLSLGFQGPAGKAGCPSVFQGHAGKDAARVGAKPVASGAHEPFTAPRGFRP